ncbi:MAG: thiamine phosphate synthase [Gammaproteobacteria bacterium]
MQKLKGLYAIADTQCIDSSQLIEKVSDVLSAGVKIIQFRDKLNNFEEKSVLANKIKSLSTKHRALLIINDDVEIAKSIDADGVHLGKQDKAIDEARHILGKDKLIGASCYDDFDNALAAIEAGADYVAFGSFFNSLSKPHAARANIDLLIRAKLELTVPICAIGGINKNNVKKLLDTEVDMIAMISALFASNTPKQTAEEFLGLIDEFDLTA